ncbi:MAG: RNA polymerase sigma-70 factor [Tannerellaceae bacterium]|jgi:RNA polymerase sigma-70 factor (ECF subfamily)|nr:RNA polymerase sigma-70 factor [Tannerellaceae bacterium]
MQTMYVESIRESSLKHNTAFENIYRQYYGQLCLFASQYVDNDECEEVVQDVMLWLWENRIMLSYGISLKSFLFAAVKNKCTNKNIRKHIAKQALETVALTLPLFESPTYSEEQEVRALLHKALLEIPMEYRITFEMNRFGRLTYNEIALRTGVSPKTVAYRISQTLKALRRNLRDYIS